MDIAILLPCKNEEHNIIKVINDWKKAIPEATIYVCDNNSTDNSFELAQSTGVKVFIETIAGKGAAIKKLLNEISADVYIMCDADDTYPATREILVPILNGYDLVVGNRLSKTGEVGKINIIKKFGNNIFSRLCKKLLKSNIEDPLSGLRAFTKQFLQGLELSNGFEIEMEMNAHASKGYVAKNIPIIYKGRDEDKSKISIFKDGYKILKTLFKCKRNNKRLLSIEYINGACIDSDDIYSKCYTLYKDGMLKCLTSYCVSDSIIQTHLTVKKISNADIKYILSNFKDFDKKQIPLEETWQVIYKNKTYPLTNVIIKSIIE